MNSRRSYHLGLIGWPVSHSRSPILHKAALEQAKLNGDYRLYPIPPLPEGKHALIDLLQQVKNGELDGLNVTIPHKQNVIPLLDEITIAAQDIGAVNTIWQVEGRLHGDNTDAPGFLRDLNRFLASQDVQLQDKTALVLGGGGSARAVCCALNMDKWQVSVAARRISQAKTLVSDLGLFRALNLNSEELAKQQPSLIVNTTPAGMHPNIKDSPWPSNIELPSGAAVYDLIYNPSETQLVYRAKQVGLPATTGLGMLVEQAALAFHTWTGEESPSQVMFDALSKEMSE